MNERKVIRNAMIYDGYGNPARPGDLVLEGGFIAETVYDGHADVSGATDVYDAQGRAAAPGFIDAHAHSDATLLAAPEAFGKVSQGITTEINGNCGHSLFPVTKANRDYAEDSCRACGVKLNWDSLKGYQAALEARDPALRTYFFCGHNTLCAAYPNDIEAQAAALEAMIRDGAPGLSTGLLYAPGRDEPEEHLLKLADVLKKTGGMYVTHLRSEGRRLEEALEEAIRYAKAGAGRLHISHLKTAGKANRGKLGHVLEMIHEAQRQGMQVSADRYPYVRSQTSLSVILPGEYDSMRDVEIQQKLAGDEAECRRLVEALREDSERVSNTLLTATTLEDYKEFCGIQLGTIAEKRGTTPEAEAIEILKRDAARAMGAFAGMSGDNLKRILEEPYVCCGTDENARPADDSLGAGHPRGFGSMPLFLNMVAEECGMSEAVRRVTSLPAEIFGLKGCGGLRKGNYADITIFDEKELGSKADFLHPHLPATGILRVYRGGRVRYEA